MAHSHDGVYLAVCFPSSIHLWKAFPLIHLSEYRRSAPSLLEHGHNQADAVQSLLRAQGWQQVQSRLDEAGIRRCTGACTPGMK